MSAPLYLIANARMPSQRAQSLQVAQVAAAFARAGAPTTLLFARRFPTPELPAGSDLFDYYAVAPVEPKPEVEAIPCVDWIDRVPTRWQYLPARLQELTFARNAALRVAAGGGRARVLSREAESAHALLRGRSPHPRVFLEVHRVPGGRSRRRWLLEASRGARGVLAISGGVAADLVELGVETEKLCVEHDGFEAGGVVPPSRQEARRQLGLDADARVVVYTGGLLVWKGVELLVEAARTLPELQFVIAGGMDSDVERIRLLAEGLANVRLDGFQPPARVATYLAAADLGVIPNRSTPAISARYTSPLKAFEAMAAGLPLVVSDLPSLRELFNDGLDARLVAPDDPAALAAGIKQLMEDEELRKSMSARLVARAPEHSWDARARRILEWMQAREESAA